MSYGVDYSPLRAVALLIRDGHAGSATPTPHQTREMARGIVAMCDALEDARGLVADDALAATCQTLGQYRSLLLRRMSRGA